MGIQSAGAAGGRSLRSTRAPDGRAVPGRRRRGFMRTPRGPGADRAVRSRAGEFQAAGRGSGQGPNGRAPAGQKKTRSGSGATQNPLVGYPVGAMGFFVALPAAWLLRMTW
jgi:hypothetical protein